MSFSIAVPSLHKAANNGLSSDSNPTPTTADPPFDDVAADVILRSSDHVDFRVYKTILSLVSPIFRTMFMLPQEQTRDSEGEIRSARDIPVVEMPERSERLHLMLTLCYPRLPAIRSRPTSESLDTQHSLVRIHDAVEIYSKFDIDEAKELAVTTMRSLAETEPVLIYMLACRYGYPHIAQEAAMCSLHRPISSIISEEVDLEGISAIAYRALLTYHQRCFEATLACVNRWPSACNWRDAGYFWFHGSTHWSKRQCPVQYYVDHADDEGVTRRVQTWLKVFMGDIVGKITKPRGIRDVLTVRTMLRHYLMLPPTGQRCDLCYSAAFDDISHFVAELERKIQLGHAEIKLDVSHIVMA